MASNKDIKPQYSFEKKTASKSSGFGGLFRGFSEGTTKMMLIQYYEQFLGRFRSGFQTADTEIRVKK